MRNRANPSVSRCSATRGRFRGVAFSPDGQAHRLGQRGRDGAAMGRGNRANPIGEPMRGHTDAVIECGVQSRRQADRLRQPRHDAAPVGRRHPAAGRGAADGQPCASNERRVQPGRPPDRLGRRDNDSVVGRGNPHTGRRTDPGTSAPIDRVVYSRDGTRIASASDDKTVRLWDALTGSPIGEPLVGPRVRGHRGRLRRGRPADRIEWFRQALSGSGTPAADRYSAATRTP